MKIKVLKSIFVYGHAMMDLCLTAVNVM